MRFSSLLIAIGVMTSMQTMVGIAPSAAATLQAHRAVYDLKVEGAMLDEGGTSRGRLVLEFSSTCAGHLVNQRLVTRTMDGEGNGIVQDYRAAFFESLDNHSFRFNQQSWINGQVIEETDGRAKLKGTGETGDASYVSPEEKPMTLPAGTIFPVGHTLRLLANARSGQTIFDDVVFDGSETGLYRIATFISRPKPIDDDVAAQYPVLTGQPSWDVQLAYYPLAEASPVPDFEMSYRLHDNGIASDILLDYGSARFVGRLVGLDLLPDADCGD